MPNAKERIKNIIQRLEDEFKVLKEFTDNKENLSISLLDLINLEKLKELFNQTKNLQGIGVLNEDLKVKQATLNLFEEGKSKNFIKQLSDIKDKFEKIKHVRKQINSLVNTYKNKPETEHQIKYIYLRIIYKKKDIDNLAKLQQLNCLATNEGNKKIIVDHLQKKFSDMGLKDLITFNNLNTFSDWHQEIEEIKQKLPTIKKISAKTSQPKPDHIPIVASGSNSLKKDTETPAFQNPTLSEEAVELPSEFLPSWKGFAEQQEHIDALEKAFNFIKTDYDTLHTEKNELQEEVTKLQKIIEQLKHEQLMGEARRKVLEVKGITQSNKEQVLNKQKEESNRKLLETERAHTELQKNTNELQSKYDAQSLSLETIRSELESAKKLLQEAEKAVSEVKSLQFDLDSANEKVKQLTVKQHSLETEIAAIQTENQKLNTDLQASQTQKAKLESTLKNLGTTLQSNVSENQKKLFEATEIIQELKDKIETNSKLIKDKEFEIFNLRTELIKTQEKYEQLENRNSTLEEQTAQLTKESNKITDEKTILDQNLTHALEKIETLKREIRNLQDKLKELSTENTLTDNKEISDLKNQLDNLNKSKEAVEASIKELTAQKKDKDDILNELTTELQSIKIDLEKANQFAKQITYLQEQNQKLEEELTTVRKNSKAIEDILAVTTEKLTSAQEDRNELSEENLKSKKYAEDLQNIHSELQKNCVTLEDELQEKNLEISCLNNKILEIESQLNNTQQEIEDLTTLLKKAEQNTHSLEKQLQELKDKENPMPIQENPLNEALLIDLNVKDDHKNSGEVNPTHFDSALSSSPTPSSTPSSISSLDLQRSNLSSGDQGDSGLNNSPLSSNPRLNSSEPTINDPNLIRPSGTSPSLPALTRSRSFPGLNIGFNCKIDGASIETNSTENLIRFESTEQVEDPIVSSRITPINIGTSMLIQQQIDNLISNPEFKIELRKTLVAKLKKHYETAFTTELHKPEYQDINNTLLQSSESEFNKLILLADNTVTYLLTNKDTISEIRQVFTQIFSDSEEEVAILSPENAAKEFLGIFIKPNTFKAPADQECDDKLLKMFDYNKTNAQQYIALLKCCEDQLLSREFKETAKKYIIDRFTQDLTQINVTPEEHRDWIVDNAFKLVAEILTPDNIFDTLEKTKVNSPNSSHLIEDTKKILSEQCNEKIQSIIGTSFAHIFIDDILKKINYGESVSEDEIEKLSPQLQYANSVVDFELGLRSLWPNLDYLNESAATNPVNCFLTVRSLLRKKALAPLTELGPEEFLQEIIDCNAETWLETKLQLITKKSIDLKLAPKQQKDLDNKFQALFSLSPLEDMAVTHKSIDELTNELEKLHDLKVKAATKLSKTFAEIEQRLSEYPNVITKDGTFQANLNNSQSLNAPDLTTAQIQILLDKINCHLKNDTTKWDLLNNNKIAEEITTDIISDPTNFEFDMDTIQPLVRNSLAILYKFHDLQEILDKRKLWNSEIQQLYALSQKLKSSSQFNQEIEHRISKLKEMLNLKENDVDENIKTFPKAMFLPHKCQIIRNIQFNSSDTEEYHLQVGSFYKQEALKIGKTITFAQELSNGDECRWSATLSNNKCLSFKTEKKRFRREKSYLQEVSFAQMVYSVNSFKDAETCTLHFGNCSQNMKERLYLFAKAYNELRHEDNELQKRPVLTCNLKNPPNLDNAKVAAAKAEIKAQLSLHTNELEDISTKLKDDTMRHQIIPSRGL